MRLSVKLLCDALSDLGFKVYSRDISLYPDVKKTGIIVETNDPEKYLTYHVDNLLENAENLEQAAGYVREWILNSRMPQIDYSNYLTREYILDHVTLALEEKLWSPNLFRDSKIPGILEYCCINGTFTNFYWKIRMYPELLEQLNLTETLVWAAAEKNFEVEKTRILPLADALPIKYKKSFSKDNPVNELFSVTNKVGIRGAIRIYDVKALQLLGKRFNTQRFFVYPQSENNFIVAPATTKNLATLRKVAEKDDSILYLINKIYCFDVEKDLEYISEFPFKAII